jgi:hypothetical protein
MMINNKRKHRIHCLFTATASDKRQAGCSMQRKLVRDARGVRHRLAIFVVLIRHRVDLWQIVLLRREVKQQVQPRLVDADVTRRRNHPRRQMRREPAQKLHVERCFDTRLTSVVEADQLGDRSIGLLILALKLREIFGRVILAQERHHCLTIVGRRRCTTALRYVVDTPNRFWIDRWSISTKPS